MTVAVCQGGRGPGEDINAPLSVETARSKHQVGPNRGRGVSTSQRIGCAALDDQNIRAYQLPRVSTVGGDCENTQLIHFGPVWGLTTKKTTLGVLAGTALKDWTVLVPTADVDKNFPLSSNVCNLRKKKPPKPSRPEGSVGIRSTPSLRGARESHPDSLAPARHRWVPVRCEVRRIHGRIKRWAVME